MPLPYKDNISYPCQLSSVGGATIIICFPTNTNSCFIPVTVIRWRLAWIFGEVVVGREREVLTTLTHSSPQIAPPSAGWGAGEKWKAGDAHWWHDDPVMFDKIPQTFIDIKDKYQALFKTTVHWAGSFLSNTFLLLDLYEFIACKMCVKNPGYDFQQQKKRCHLQWRLHHLCLHRPHPHPYLQRMRYGSTGPTSDSTQTNGLKRNMIRATAHNGMLMVIMILVLFNSDTGDHGSLADSNNVQNNVDGKQNKNKN